MLVLCYALFCLVLGIGLGEIAFRAWKAPITAPPPFLAVARQFGAELQQVSVNASDGVVLRAWFLRPTKARAEAVILLHGVGDNREGMTGFAELFISHGYSVLLPDVRAHGTSGGDFPTYGIKEVDDLHRWYAWLQKRERFDCVFGMGESMGAAIILQAVRTIPFCAVVAESPFASFRQIAYIRVGQIFHGTAWLGRILLRPAVELGLLYGRLTRGVNLGQASPQESVIPTSIPILLIHGLADNNIPPHQSEIIQAQNPRHVNLWEVPDAGHCGASNTAPSEFNLHVLGWFAAHNDSNLQQHRPTAPE